MEKILSSEKIERIKTDDFFRQFVEPVRDYAESEIKKPTPELKYSAFRLFRETGDRTLFEESYFNIRGRLNAFAFMYILYREEKYKTALEDCIWSICDEYSWAVPAHIVYEMPMEDQQTWIDLFAAETGSALSEILSLVGEDLSESVVTRAKKEIRRRIIDPYVSHKHNYFWETVTNNWAAVCAGSVGVTMFYEASGEEVETVLPRLCATMDCFLSGFYDDGCCLEGLSYWNYGFGFFTYFADMLKKYTNGGKDLFAFPKVRAIAQFQQNMLIGKTHCVSFSDAGSRFSSFPGLSSYLYNKFDEVSMPPVSTFSKFGSDHCHRWLAFIRNFSWLEPSVLHGKVGAEYVYYKDAQWYIRNTEKFSFAAKGGTNSESHNHNDLGSFIFISEDKQILNDFGSGLYTRQYFSELRYTYLVTSSRGHSVPIINGKYQSEGEQYRAGELNVSRDVFEIDLTKGYDDESLSEFTRRFDILDNGIKITDRFNFVKKPSELTERFFTCIRPEITEDAVIIENCRLTADFSMYNVKITEERFEAHSDAKSLQIAYLIDFEVKKPEKTNDFVFEVRNADTD